MTLTRQSRGVVLIVTGLVAGLLLAAGAWVLLSDRSAEAVESQAAEATELVDRLEALGYEVTTEPVAEEVVDAVPAVTPAPVSREPVAATSGAERAPAASQPRTPNTEPAPRTVPTGEAPSPAPMEPPAPEPGPAASEEEWTAPTPVDEDPGAYRAPEPASVERVLISAGDRIRVRLEESLSSATARPGDRFELVVEDAFHLGGGAMLAAGTPVRGYVAEVQGARRPQKPGRLELAAEELLVGDRWYPIDAFLTADGDSIRGRGSHEEDARDIGIGAAAGTVLGAILGGKRGALAGLVLGGGGVFLATKGEEVELPAGMSLIAEIERDTWVTVPGR